MGGHEDFRFATRTGPQNYFAAWQECQQTAPETLGCSRSADFQPIEPSGRHEALSRECQAVPRPGTSAARQCPAIWLSPISQAESPGEAGDAGWNADVNQDSQLLRDCN